MSVEVYNRVSEIVGMVNKSAVVKNAAIGIETVKVTTTAGVVTFAHDENNGWVMTTDRVSGSACDRTQARALYKLMFDLARGLCVKPELRTRFGLTR